MVGAATVGERDLADGMYGIGRCERAGDAES
jgi:hypothetical protein